MNGASRSPPPIPSLLVGEKSGNLAIPNISAFVERYTTVDAALTHATGTAEREAALAMLDRRKRSGRITLGADKAYDVTAFVEELSAR
jgi:hypothetical protein